MLKPPKFPNGFQESIFKGFMREESHRVCDWLMRNSLVDGEVTGWCHITNPQTPVGLGLCAHGHQVVNFFYLLRVFFFFSIYKTLQNMGTRYYYLFLPRGAKVEDIGEGSVVGKPHSVLLSYTCLDKKINKKSLLCVHTHQLHLQLLSNKTFLVVVQSLSHVRLFVTPWTAARQASQSFTISQSLLKLMTIESVMPSHLLILCCSLLLLPSIFPSIRVFSSEAVLPWFFLGHL